MRVVENPTALDAVEQNFRRLKSILEKNEIHYFGVRSLEKYRVVVGVRAADKPRLLRALHKNEGTDAPYIRQIVPPSRLPSSALHASDPNAIHKFRSSSVLRTTWFFTDASESIVFGEEYGCEIEFWTAEENATSDSASVEQEPSLLVAPRPNAVTRKVLASDAIVDHPFSRFTRLRPGVDHTKTLPTVEVMTVPLTDDIEFPIDIVFTWVDSNDLNWMAQRAAFLGQDLHEEAASISRFMNRDELRYSLRSIHQYAPWVRDIYIVTAGQTPSWLDTDAPGVHIVDHRDLFSSVDDLPTFNSHAIESQIHKIPELAEHFLYLNDDMFFGRPVLPQTFFASNGVAKFFPSPSRVPFWPVRESDTPVDQATKNGRKILQREFGVQQAQVMEHAPYALRKSVINEMESKFPEVFSGTASNRFRSMKDYNIPSNLAHHYGYLTRNAMPSSLSFSYIGLSVHDLEDRLARMLARRDRDAFCLNDTFTKEEDLVHQMSILSPFLDAYYPARSPWEKESD